MKLYRARSVVLLLLAGGILAAPAMACSSGSLSRGELRKQLETGQSVSAEGALLAHETERRNVIGSYREVHADQLRKNASSVAKALNRGAADLDLEPTAREAAELIEGVEEQLGRLHDSASNAGDVEAELEHRKNELQELAEQL